MILNCLAVGLGGFIGSIVRYACGVLAPQAPFASVTFAINIVGSFALALFAAWCLGGVIADERLSLFLRVGLCGGFTTFSTFSLEASNCSSRGKSSKLCSTFFLAAHCACSHPLLDHGWVRVRRV